AAVILEPMNVEQPKADFLAVVQDMAHAHGALLIFDATITGFRLDLGGAQKLFGVTPDLSTFGKGLANGYPLSAVVGRSDVMKEMEEVFFSFTFGGETLSLAAARATLKKLRREPVLESIHATGAEVMRIVAERIAEHDLSRYLQTAG